MAKLKRKRKQKMYDVITIGSATIDVFLKTHREIITKGKKKNICYHLGDKVLIDNIKISTGGGGTNIAVALARLGLKTAFLGVLGSDINSEIILKELKNENVDFLGKIKEGNTGYSVVLPSHNDRTILVYKGVNDYLEKKDIDFNKIKSNWLIVSTMMGKSFETIIKISDYGRKNNIKIALNISSYLAEKGLFFLSKLLKNTDILILNREELELLTKDSKIQISIKKLSKYSSGIIVVTDGNKAIRAFDRNKTYTKKIKTLHPVNKTGAGDAFAAGFIYGIFKDKNVEDALSFGHREASSVLLNQGAKAGLLRRL